MNNTAAKIITSDEPDSGFAKKNNQQKLYRIIWRWHFYAGLFAIPFILTLSVSGAIYLFKPQIDTWVDQPYQHLTISGDRATANQHISAAIASLPGSEFIQYQLPQSDNQAIIITVKYQGDAHLVYVHPYTLDIVKSVRTDDLFIRQVRTFHGELLAGNVGSILVELAACWAIVLIISGLYLSWPRSGNGIAGVLYPRLRSGNRIFWRDIHAVTGFWLAGFALFLLITGLPWALVWGGVLKELRQTDMHAHHQPSAWSSGRAAERVEIATIKNGTIDLTANLLASAQALQLAPPVELAPEKNQPNIWTAKSQHPNRPLRVDVWLDGRTGAVLHTNDFSQKGNLDKAIGIGIAAHEGQLFGWFNQLLGVLTTLGLILMSITGFILWRRRKPATTLGAPPALPNARAGKAVTLIVLALALFLPLLALSLVALALFEWLVVNRIPPLREWLGMPREDQ